MFLLCSVKNRRESKVFFRQETPGHRNDDQIHLRQVKNKVLCILWMVRIRIKVDGAFQQTKKILHGFFKTGGEVRGMRCEIDFWIGMG